VQDILLFLVGIAVGATNSIAGGGVLLAFPVFLALGLSPIVANVTCNIVAVPGCFSSAYGYRKYLRKMHRRYLVLLVPCIAGSATGAFILSHTTGAKFQQIVPALVGCAVILFAFQPLLHAHLRGHIHGRRKDLKSLGIIAVALIPAAIYGGYFGAGFGFIMLAFLGFTKLHEIHRMNGLKNLAAGCITLTSATVLYSHHLINWRFGLVTAAGCTLGGYYGSVFSQKVSSHAIRVFVIVIGVGTAAYLAFRSY